MIGAIGALAGVVVLVVAVVAGIAATRPGTMDIQRSVTIDAPPDRVYALVSDLHRWPEWQPDDERDPTAVRTFGGPQSGAGATSQWSGKRSAGSMLMTQADENRRVTVEVDFAKPFTAHNVNVLELDPAATVTNVTWRWHGQLPYIARVMGVFVDMNGALGKHFEDGLNKLKALAES